MDGRPGAGDPTAPSPDIHDSVPAAASTVTPAASGPRRQVLLVDSAESRVRRPRDLLDLVLSLLGIGVVLLLAVYAHSTTQGVTRDVQDAVAPVLHRLLLLPVTVLEGVVTLFLPILVVLIELLRQRWRPALFSVVAAVAAGALASLVVWLIDVSGPSSLAAGLTFTYTEENTIVVVVALNPFTAALAALLTAVATRSQRKTVRWGWTLLWVVLGLNVMQGAVTLPGALVAVLLGRAVGLGIRYIGGVRNRRAIGLDLVTGIRRAGIDPVEVVRLDEPADDADLQAWRITTSAPVGYTERGLDTRRRLDAMTPAPGDGTRDATPATGPATAADRPGPAPGVGATPPRRPDVIVPDVLTDPHVVLSRTRTEAPCPTIGSPSHRTYSVRDAVGQRWTVTVLDTDRQVVGYLATMWSTLRMPGIERRRAASVRTAAEHAALMRHAIDRAGVRSPSLAGIAEVAESVLLVSTELTGSRSFGALSAAEVSEECLDELWAQLRRAHAIGLAHRDLAPDSIVIDAQGRPTLVGWESGEIASIELVRLLDAAQLLTLTATVVGPERALDAAGRALGTELLGAVAPLLQPVVLPGRTRAATENHRALLNTLRAAIVDEHPAADTPPARLSRFSARTILMVTLGIAAVWLLLGTLNFAQIAEAVRTAQPGLLVLAFGLGLLMYLGSAMALIAFSPQPLGLWRTTQVQVAGSLVALVAPAGVGATAVNLRFLAKRRIPTPLAVATVGLTQVFQVVSTVALLVTIALVTGSVGRLSFPAGIVTAAVLVVAAILTTIVVVPPARHFVWRLVGPTLQQVWPRLMWVVGSPRRLLIGVAGNLLITMSQIAAFYSVLAAFGYELEITTLAITFLTSNTVGSVVPSPGGVGPVEAALTAGLTVAGVPAGIAFSAALTFRVLTFWARAPFGWLAMRHLQRKGEL